MTPFRLFDAYALRARLFPAVIASASMLIAIWVVVPWNKLTIAHAAASFAVPIILFAMADIARRLGKAKEPKLYVKWDGMPTTRMMRHTDSTLDSATKAAYLNFVAGKLKTAVPTAQEEAASPQKADAFYSRCAAWLRENTRDTKKFSILFNENITYGYRRNLFALKWPAIVFDLLIIIAVGTYTFQTRPEFESEPGLKVLILIAVAAVHAVYMSFAATENSVREAGNTYARQLFLCCESLGGAAKTKPARRS